MQKKSSKKKSPKATAETRLSSISLVREPDEKPRVQTAARTVGILLAVAQSQNGLKAKEIGSALKLSGQVAYHLLHTLSATGILRRTESGRYVLGLAAATIADGFKRQLAPPEQLAAHVRALAATSGETAYAVGWVDGKIVVLATARGNSPVQAAEVPHGFSGDAHARASGKLLLALADPSIVENYIESHKFTARTPHTITSKRKFLAELQRIRARGYGLDEEEFSEGLCCLAVPVDNLAGRIVLGVSVPVERFHGGFERYLDALRSAARLHPGAA